MRGGDLAGWEHVPLRSRPMSDEAGLRSAAGRAAAQVVDRLYPRGLVAVVTGPGPVGACGAEAARALGAWGREVVEVHASDGSPAGAAAAPEEELPLDRIRAADVVVDALGPSSPPEAVSRLAGAITASRRPVVSLDAPAGVDVRSGAAGEFALRAGATIALGAPWPGLLLHPGRSHAGRIVVVEIGEGSAGAAEAALITPGWSGRRLPDRAATADKVAAGTLLVLAGEARSAASAAIPARAALRSGAGFVRVASAAENRGVVQAASGGALFQERPFTAAREVYDALLVGPGMRLDEEARAEVARLLDATPGVPAVVDATAIPILCPGPDALRALAGERRVVVTPNAGEMAAFLDMAAEEVRRAPLEMARAAAEETGACILLKGEPSVVAAPGEPLLVNTTGSADAAKIGMGDSLAGVVASFLAQGASPREAAALAIFYCGRAADLARRGRGLIADDVADALPQAFARPGDVRSALRLGFVSFDQPPPRARRGAPRPPSRRTPRRGR